LAVSGLHGNHEASVTSDNTPSSRRLRLGGVYYVELPPVVAEDKDQASWIEFGRPPKDILLKNEVPTVRVQPQEGLMVLYPS